jgi:arginine decarboxylase
MVFCLTPGDDEATIALLVEALSDLAANAGAGAASGALSSAWPPAVPEMAMTPRDGALRPVDLERVPLERAAGRIAGEMVVPYPPGIPLPVAGEVISAEVIEAVAQLGEVGCRIVGTADPLATSLLCHKA